MPRPRKTVSLAEVVTIANRRLACTPDEMTDERRATSSFACELLMDANAYAGFRYIGEGNQAGAIDDTRVQIYPPKGS